MWDEVIASNIRSYEAKLKRVERNPALGWNLHAYHWLLYGYLQKNDVKNAELIIENMKPYIASIIHLYQVLCIEMAGNYMLRQGNGLTPLKPMKSNRGPQCTVTASQLFLEGL